MTQLYSSELVLKNTAEAVIVPLKYGVSSLNTVYQALINAAVDPVTEQCSNYTYIRQHIVQSYQHLEQSEQTASSGLKSLDENLERLIQQEGKLERKMNDTNQTLENLTTKQESNEKLLRDSQGALEQVRRNVNSTKQTLQNQEYRKNNTKIITGVGAGLLAIPVFGWIAGSAMIINGAVEMEQAEGAVKVAEEQVKKSETEVEKYEIKVSDYESKISQTSSDIRKKDEKLKQMQEGIQKVKKNQRESVADYQNKVRSAVHLLSVLSERASVAEHQTRRFILQEPVMKVMEDEMKAVKEMTGNELLYSKDMMRLVDQMKENHQRLAAICASENI